MGTEPSALEAIAVRPLSGADEEALLDALDAGAPVAAVLSLLLGRCAHDGTAMLDRRATSLTVGQREALALRLRAATLGTPMRATMTCPACGEAMELVLDAAALAAAAPMPTGSGVLEADGFRLACRPVTGEDQEAAASAAEPGSDAGRRLLSRCVAAVDAEGSPVPIEALPPSVADRAAAFVLELDPASETTLQAHCPACGAPVTGALDAGGFVTAELARRVTSLPAEVLAIARATGWHETAILAMPPARRRRYAALLAPEAPS